jgi:hypothetical protein
LLAYRREALDPLWGRGGRHVCDLGNLTTCQSINRTFLLDEKRPRKPEKDDPSGAGVTVPPRGLDTGQQLFESVHIHRLYKMVVKS